MQKKAENRNKGTTNKGKVENKQQDGKFKINSTNNYINYKQSKHMN